ncbi:MAG: hypothetical protein FJX44_05605 [Alphaproteobacteria bacterium]|nr:hypothetical protein [Alphaproteobacteria bacterium]
MKGNHLAGAKDGDMRLLFLPSRRQAAILAAMALGTLALALFFRYGLIENTPLALACEAGEEGLVCAMRLGVVFLFMWNVFGVAAISAACVQLWRPDVKFFGAGLVFALLGLVLYNTRLSGLAMALLVLSLARPVPEAR